MDRNALVHFTVSNQNENGDNFFTPFTLNLTIHTYVIIYIITMIYVPVHLLALDSSYKKLN